jgi:phosphoribosylformylglycinamidine synthase
METTRPPVVEREDTRSLGRSATLAPEAVGLTRTEGEEIARRLGRSPEPLELRMFGVMWSEHCGYKHSKAALQLLPTDSPHVLHGPGENAGVLAIGGGWAIAFKMESHNHPSAVDPFNGAATGVGGIIRDILAMGARPIALIDSLRFGPLDDPRSRRQASGIVAGIAAYGNCVGIPTVAGELVTHPGYRGSPLVNVACLGLLRQDEVARSRASGPGNPVLLVGARTGRDGIGGAAFASEELDDRSERTDRASVQIGDPFAGKLLIEATLEARRTGDVIAIQDLGAAGLTCATSEMAARGGVGMTVDLALVPLREDAMRAEEILLSESQERMLLVVRAGAEDRVASIFRRWGLTAAVVGEVVSDPVLVVRHGGATVVSLPPYALAEAPIYRPAAREPDTLRARWTVPVVPDIDPAQALLTLLASPGVASKRAVYEQFDHMVQLRTVVAPGAADAAVLRLPELAPRALALACDGDGRLASLDPYRGARRAVAEAAANLACVGAVPLGITDCLNFANPKHPEVFWAFRQAVTGIADACRALKVPVVGGNVSFYNESPDGPVPPTPVIAMVGLVEDVSRTCRAGFAAEDAVIVLVGDIASDLAASSYLFTVHGVDAGRPADVDFDSQQRALVVVREAVAQGWLASAHDCSDGGAAVALAECAVLGGIGAEVTLPEARELNAALFGEAPSRFVLSLPAHRLADVQTAAATHGVPLHVVGRTGGDRLRISGSGVAAGRWAIDLPVTELAVAHAALRETL